jgi:glycosyltransferase involved in cell wall biosynthesis
VEYQRFAGIPIMRIAYVTPYQGSALIKRRPIVANRSMSNRIKIELIAQLLHAKGHDVEVFSYGEVERPEFRFYPAFQEPEPFHPRIPVHYISALPIRRLYGFWARLQMWRLLDRRHGVSPFDVVIIFNFKPPQIASARYAVRRRIPLILEYEDDVFRSVSLDMDRPLRRYHHETYRRILATTSGCIAVSPHLLLQVPPAVPKLLLRGVVGDDLLDTSERFGGKKRDIVLFSGSHNKWNGAEELITAWRSMALPDWQLHITGYGNLTESLREMAKGDSRIVFHGLVAREKLVELMASAKIGISPQRVSPTLGDQFPFKVIEYLAAGAHVVMTPMGNLESEIEQGITYMADNLPETIASTLHRVIVEQRYTRTAEVVVQQRYGTKAVSESLDGLLSDVVTGRQSGSARSRMAFKPV